MILYFTRYNNPYVYMKNMSECVCVCVCVCVYGKTDCVFKIYFKN